MKTFHLFNFIFYSRALHFIVSVQIKGHILLKQHESEKVKIFIKRQMLIFLLRTSGLNSSYSSLFE